MSASTRWVHVGAWLVATALVAALAERVGVGRVVDALRAADAAWLVVAVACNALILPLASLQWRALLPAAADITGRRLFRVVALTSIANNTTPSLVGHVTGAALLAAEPGVGRAAALSVLALDQIAVGLAKLLVFLLAGLLVPLPGWMRAGVLSLATAVAALMTLTVWSALLHRRAGTWSARLTSRLWLRRVVDLFAEWTMSLEAARRPRRFGEGLAYAVAIKAAEAVAIVAVMRAFQLELPTAGVLLVLAATALATFVPFVPANLGTYEASTYAAYRVLGVAPDVALGVALVQHACQLLPAISIGYAMLTRGPRQDAPDRATAQRP